MNTHTNTQAFDATDFCGPVKPAAKRGRPAKYASAAERQAAYRAANTLKTVRLDGKIAPTVAALAEQFDCDETHVINNLLRFALANRNWKGMGIGGWDITDRRAATGKRAAPQVDTDLDAFALV